ncbi:Cell cycle serine/threonine-protein kinase cdc5/MSD2 [Pleurotus ostreatus]|uniref:Serine/threonine-protein kinase n=1 Tax=Pleurotus ostreatus TaxID=5322 RepID=A0A8H7DT32_PLEOS|nr:Cell cycle serine/threonine-protein kinase cdc5/MSD2 [Pleurotus ostreatus]KAF7426061.1 Cell cycle serine/threonine-protein kinase cdc5/MSD2 [Pleurotus ostreatus]KAJ8693484.1 Cell cycle serine/threonine-protein kinase cdc5/MSD2 [Pleurotus ostreatus]
MSVYPQPFNPRINMNPIPTHTTSRRPPFTNAHNQHNVPNAALSVKALPKAPRSPPPKLAEKKPPSSPPLSRQTTKAIPPSPPRIIKDAHGLLQFQKVGLLGEGGFARVYEVKDVHGNRLACKVLSKSSLQSKKAKTKLWAEIKIHRSLAHPNIVQFQECFDDDENVYMALELCSSGSLMDLLRRRRRLTEPEARYFKIQIIGACHYMHTHQVIHRDLKLGNILLDSDMNIRVADFGLAALIENPGERKKTICGTPNYIAPEVLFDTANGHSFEVDTWSVGVMLYTLLIGRPPFQTKDVKSIYKRIRDNEYDFPAERPISSHARTLIQAILTPDPNDRPSLHEILDHPFFIQGLVPGYIPVTAQDGVPDFRHVTRAASEQNFIRLKRECMLDEDQQTSIKLPSKVIDNPAVERIPNHVGVSVPTSSLGKSITSSLAQQEKEFQKAVQPGSPIADLLTSARQPLLMANNATHHRGEPLMRKLQAAAKESPLAKSARAQSVQGGSRTRELDPMDHREEDTRKKLVESQKARIVAQMVPVRESDEEEEEEEPTPLPRPIASASSKGWESRDRRDQENIPPTAVAPLRSNKGKEPVRSKTSKDVTMVPPAALKQSTTQHPAPSVLPPQQSSSKQLNSKLTGFDAALQVLSLAFDAKSHGKVFKDPREDPTVPLRDEKVFIVSWVDYCNKYGMGYALTDGSMGVYFNDSTSMILSADKRHFDYISARHGGSVYVRKSHTVDEYPEELKSKVYLLKHFERYIMERLYSENDYTWQATERTKGMDWVQKYLRMKHVIVFKMSHDVLQFNFYDHSKLILSSHGLVVTHIDKNYNITRWTLSDIMATSLHIQARGRTGVDGGSGSTITVEGMDADQIKFNQKLVEKLKYCKEVLLSIRNASANGGTSAAGSVAGSATSGHGAPAETMGMSTRTSKASLR